jgi:hypothetical protein
MHSSAVLLLVVQTTMGPAARAVFTMYAMPHGNVSACRTALARTAVAVVVLSAAWHPRAAALAQVLRCVSPPECAHVPPRARPVVGSSITAEDHAGV